MNRSRSSVYTALCAWPRVGLNGAPTPLRHLNHLSILLKRDVWVKCDNELALGDATRKLGGNKVRKLDHLLMEARRRGARSILAIGSAGSNHLAATSWYGRAMGFDVISVTYPQPMDKRARLNRILIQQQSRKVFAARRVRDLPALLTRLGGLSSPTLFRMPMGGSSPLGAIGYIIAGMEYAFQVQAGGMPRPERVYLPVGSGSTLVGLAIGFTCAGLSTMLHGVRIVPRIVANRRTLRSLMMKTIRLLRERDIVVPDVPDHMWHIDGRFVGRGYGHPTPESRLAIDMAAKDGLELDPIYTGKAFAALSHPAVQRSHSSGRPWLFWHTLGPLPPDAVEGSPRRGK